MKIWTKLADTTLGNSVAETTILDTGQGRKTLRPNFFIVGRVLGFQIRGYYTTIITPTLTLKFKLGSVVLVSTGAVVLTTIGTAKGWKFSGSLTCRSTGGTGAISVEGKGNFSTATIDTLGWDNTTGTVAVDTTIEQTMDITAQWGTASASNTLTSTFCKISISE